MKYLFAVLMLSTCVGCASQPSTYEDRSTSDQRDIKATGQAATEAARSNKSNNADIKVQGTNTSNVKVQGTTTGDIVVYRNGKRDHRAELRMMQRQMHNRNGRQSVGEYTENRFDREWDHRIKRKIDAEMDRFLDKIF